MDKRFTGNRYFQFVSVLQKIPVFKHLTVDQFSKLLSISRTISMKPHQLLCVAGEESHEMYVLLSGELTVIGARGEELSRITSIGIVGEMGLFTGEDRSATVEVAEDAIVLVIGRDELFELFKTDHGLALQILSNVIRDLSRKLKQNNIVIEELRHVCKPETMAMTIDELASLHNRRDNDTPPES